MHKSSCFCSRCLRWGNKALFFPCFVVCHWATVQFRCHLSLCTLLSAIFSFKCYVHMFQNNMFSILITPADAQKRENTLALGKSVLITHWRRADCGVCVTFSWSHTSLWTGRNADVCSEEAVGIEGLWFINMCIQQKPKHCLCEAFWAVCVVVHFWSGFIIVIRTELKLKN